LRAAPFFIGCGRTVLTPRFTCAGAAAGKFGFFAKASQFQPREMHIRCHQFHAVLSSFGLLVPSPNDDRGIAGLRSKIGEGKTLFEFRAAPGTSMQP
jgi:hypothetical protein